MKHGRTGQWSLVRRFITSGCLLLAVASLGNEAIGNNPAPTVGGTKWAYADSRGRHFELRFEADGAVVVRRLKTEYRGDPRNKFGPGIPRYEIQVLKVGSWTQHDAAVEFSIEDVDVTEFPAKTHPIGTYQGLMAGFGMKGEATESSLGATWRWTAESIRDPNERGDGPPLLLLADEPSFPFESGHQSGEAKVRIKVSPSGDVSEVRVIKATHRVFGNKAKEAILQWKFVPHVKGGIAVEGTVETTVVFHRRNSP